MGVKLTINREDQSEENNHWFDLRAGNAVSFCANQHDDDRGNYYIDKTSNYDRNDYFHNLYRRGVIRDLSALLSAQPRELLTLPARW